MIGYMPGHMPWKYGERLRELGWKKFNTIEKGPKKGQKTGSNVH